MSEPRTAYVADDAASSRSATGLASDLITHVTELFRKELMLFRAEMSEKSTQAMTAIGMIVAGAIIALTALNVLAAALVAAIENMGLAAGWAALLVGVVFAALAYVLMSRGSTNLKATNLAPQRTAHSASRDAAMVKEKL